MRVFLYIWPYIIRNWHLQVAALVLSIISACLALVQPLLFQTLVDDVLLGDEARLLTIMLIGYAGVHVAGLLAEIARHYVSILAGNRGVVDLRNDLVRHLRRLSLKFFYREQTGRIMSVMTTDAPAVERLLQSLFPNVLMDLCYVAAMGYMIGISGNPLLTGIALLMIPFYVFFPAAVSRSFRRAFRQVQESNADISAGLQESISSTREVLAYNREEWDQQRLNKLFVTSLFRRLSAVLLEARYGGLQNLISFVSPYLVLLVGALYILREELTIGYVLAFQQWTQLMYTHARSLYNTYQSIQQSLGAAERVVQFLEEPVDPVRKSGTRVLPSVDGNITMESVVFSYDGGVRALDEITLEIKPGTKVALVGYSGSGKSTLVHLLLRYFDPDLGRILLDSWDYRDLDVSWLREQIGVVFQDPFLFSGTIQDNIAFGREDASLDDIRLAAEMAQITPFADEFPHGLQTIIGERGVRLSGGQKQRIAIARAILRRPRIFILDEATSALDSDLESRIQLAIDSIAKEKTTIIIAHRLSTVRSADLIVVLDKGRIVEQGTHEELLRKGQHYAKLYQLQFRDETA